MSVIISDEILQASQLTPSEFRQEIAILMDALIATSEFRVSSALYDQILIIVNET